MGILDKVKDIGGELMHAIDNNVKEDAQNNSGDAKSYTVQTGDTLSSISKHFYNDASKYMKIFEANKGQLTNPDLIKPGMVLQIPA